MVEPRRAEPLAQEVILPPALFVAGRRVLSPGMHLSQRAVRLDAQLVGGNVLRTPVQQLFQGPRQHFVTHLRHPEDHIHAHIFHSGLAQQADCLPRSGGIVAPPHPAQHPVVQGLDPHADAVRTQLPQTTDIPAAFLHDVLGIDFDGKLVTGTRVHGTHDPLQTGKRQHRRCASSKIQGAYGERAADLLLPARCFRTDIFHVPVADLRAAGDLRIEIAVGAETAAERDVDVDHAT